MGCAVNPLSNSCMYHGNSKIFFDLTPEKHLHVTIETEHLRLTSVESRQECYDDYATLFGSPVVLEKYADGKLKTREEIQKRIDNIWVRRWRENDPYAAFAVHHKETNAFMGHAVLGHGDRPGQSELAYLFHPQFWNKGYGTEAVMALVQEYAPLTVEKGYTLEGKPLETIEATTREDNEPSWRILEKAGMHCDGTEIKFGAIRRHYSIDLSEIQKQSSDKTASSFQEFLEYYTPWD